VQTYSFPRFVEELNPYLFPTEEQEDPRKNLFVEDDLSKQSKMLMLATRKQDTKVAFLHKGGSLIYLALSTSNKESVSFLKKQLENLHCQLISIGTSSLLKTLKSNPSYDVMSEIYPQAHLLKNMCYNSEKDPATFLN